jgi:hypothetical protein
MPIKSQGGWLSTFEAIAAGATVIVSPEMTASSIIQGYCLGIVSTDFTRDILSLGSRIVLEKCQRQQWVKDNLRWEDYCNSMENQMIDIVGVR